MIILASRGERILLDFESVAINAFISAFPRATVTGYYFHLTQSIIVILYSHFVLCEKLTKLV